MEKKKAGWKQKLMLTVASSFFVIGLLGIGEVYCRLFTRINFLDNSRGLFAYNVYGKSYGNTPNFEGVSFGETFYTDENGFRYDPQFRSPTTENSDAILILGDSVAFGPALTDDKTIAGNLRRMKTDARFYNASAIGYDTFDYRNAATAIVAKKPEIKTVLLFFCLNDVNDASAQLIRSRTDSAEAPSPESVSVPRRINDYLRSRSKLYLWLKNALVDTQMNYFKADFAHYQKGDKNLSDALQPVADLRDGLAVSGISLKLFLLPYGAQLRGESPQEFFEPQRMLAAYFERHGIDFYDTTPDFQKTAANKNELFLYGDPMHLSAEGSRLVATAACAKLENCKPTE